MSIGWVQNNPMICETLLKEHLSHIITYLTSKDTARDYLCTSDATASNSTHLTTVFARSFWSAIFSIILLKPLVILYSFQSVLSVIWDSLCYLFRKPSFMLSSKTCKWDQSWVVELILLFVRTLHDIHASEQSKFLMDTLLPWCKVRRHATSTILKNNNFIQEVYWSPPFLGIFRRINTNFNSIH